MPSLNFLFASVHACKQSVSNSFDVCRDLQDNRIEAIAPGAFKAMPSLTRLYAIAAYPSCNGY